MQRLKNKKILVTGASSGIGQAIAIACANEGADIAFSYHHNNEGAAQTLKQIEAVGSKGFAIRGDISQISTAYRLIQEAVQQLECVDVLINNAGMMIRHDSFLDITLDSFETIQALNLRTPFILMQEAAKEMQRRGRGGSIINISSMSAEIITPGLTHYECSKAALHALTRGAASDLASFNIRVNAIAPGLVATNMNKAQREGDPEAWQRRSTRIPLGRVGCPEDIAAVAVFLASPEAAWITGDVIPVDGGLGVLSPFQKPKE